MKIVNEHYLQFSKEDVYEFTKEESNEIDKAIEEYNEQNNVNLYDEPFEDKPEEK